MSGNNYKNHLSKKNQIFNVNELSFDPKYFYNSPLIKKLSSNLKSFIDSFDSKEQSFNLKSSKDPFASKEQSFNLRSSKDPISKKEQSFGANSFSKNQYKDKLRFINNELSFINFDNIEANDKIITPQISFNNIIDDENLDLLAKKKFNEQLFKEISGNKEPDKIAKDKVSFYSKKDSKSLNRTKKNISPDTNDKIKQEQVVPSITNIVAIANLQCKIDIKKIAFVGKNIEFNKTRNFIKIDLKNSRVKGLLFSSGKMRITGVNSKEQLKVALKSYKNMLKKWGYPSIKINMKEIKYVLFTGTCDIKYKLSFEKLKNNLLDFDKTIKIKNQIQTKKLFPAVIYSKKTDSSNLTLTIFHSGKINITGAKKEEDIYNEINRIYPVLLECRI